MGPSNSNSVDKPKGGYRRLNTVQMCMAWTAYRHIDRFSYFDFRVYFALHEVDERRRAENRRRKIRSSCPRRFEYDRTRLCEELRSLVGGAGGRYIPAALRRIEAAGLATCSATSIEFTDGPDDMPSDLAASVGEMLNRIHHRSDVRVRAVPLPRTAVRYLAGGAKSSHVATMLGHAIRCLWLGSGSYNSTGACSASFIARLFGIHERTVKHARHDLRQMDWLIPLASNPWHVNAHGQLVEINLNWDCPKAVDKSNVQSMANVESPPQAPPNSDGLPPPTRSYCCGMPPPESKQNLLSELKNHNPAGRGPDESHGDSRKQGRATLGHIRERDLRDSRLLRDLFNRAAERGLVSRAQAEFLRFSAAAEYAQRVATRNPCGLFAKIVHEGLWHFIAQVDEDAALRRMHREDPHWSVQPNKPAPWNLPQCNLPSNSLHDEATVETSSSMAVQIESVVASVAARTSMDRTFAANAPTRVHQTRRRDACSEPGQCPTVRLATLFPPHQNTHVCHRPAARDPVGRRSPDRAKRAGDGL